VAFVNTTGVLRNVEKCIIRCAFFTQMAFLDFSACFFENESQKISLYF
jgi:hypothetical protein